MQLGRRAELTDDDVDAIARDVAAARHVAPAPASSDPREAAARELERLAAGSGDGAVSQALRSLAGFSRGDWPEDAEEFAHLTDLGRELAALSGESASRLAEADAARAQLARDMQRFVDAAAHAPGDPLVLRVDALETAVHNLRTRLAATSERAAPPAAPGPHIGSAATDAGAPPAAQAQLVNELRARVSKAEAENAALCARLDGVESQVAHMERILEAAAGFAAEERGAKR